MRKYSGWIISITLGATVGFFYWFFIGCDSGSCAITSSPVNSTLYGALFGALLVNSFKSGGVKGTTGPSEK
jgi:hypothetical protein